MYVCMYRNAIYTLIQDIVPVSVAAFEDYHLGAMTLTRLEVEAIRNRTPTINTKNKREQDEWKEKQARLFPPPPPSQPSD